VTIEEPTETQTDSGNVRYTWSAVLSDVEARVLPLVVAEERKTWATPEEDAYEIQLRGAHPTLRPLMRVAIDSEVYDIRRILQPPPFGDPSTILQSVRVTP
jgi:hypothetical protein